MSDEHERTVFRARFTLTKEEATAQLQEMECASAIAAAKEAVVEAAKGWAGNHSLSSTIRANLADALRDAIAHLLEVESEHG